MIPRVERAILELLEQGHAMSKHDAAARVFCDQRTAQKILVKLHSERKIFIVRWEPSYQQLIPVFSKGTNKNKPKPKPISNKVRLRNKRRTDPEFCIREAMRKRQKRFLEKQQKLGDQVCLTNGIPTI